MDITADMELYNYWLANTRGELKKELESVAGDETAIHDRFYKSLEFGTAGLRGILGAGTNRMNVHVVAQATQGFANCLKKQFKTPSVAIAYDSRRYSREFAQTAASVLAGNNITVYIYRELMPTPCLSYAVRALNCSGGICVTASHNPAEYNGYKAYGPNGCQIGPETAEIVQEEIAKTDVFKGILKLDFEAGLNADRIRYISEKLIDSYYTEVLKQQCNPGVCAGSGLTAVYTPLNGTGNKPVRKIFELIGFSDYTVVAEQENPDPDFTTCPYPNPEMPAALERGLKQCDKNGADLLIATDPDADRLGMAVRNKRGGYTIISGNEAGGLMLNYICESRKAAGTLPEKPLSIKSIVTTELTDAVAAEYGVELYDVLTGFKFIGEQMDQFVEWGRADDFIFAYEESCGYVAGLHCRDKDAVYASMITCEMAAYYKKQGKTLLDVLEGIYAKHGYYLNKVESFEFKGSSGMLKMSSIMDFLRADRFQNLGPEIAVIYDYLTGVRLETATGKTSEIGLPPSNVLRFSFKSGNSLIVRPSGTEPKIKFYYSMVDKDAAAAQKLYEKLSPKVKAYCKL